MDICPVASKYTPIPLHHQLKIKPNENCIALNSIYSFSNFLIAFTIFTDIHILSFEVVLFMF
jgi:hypothetical protein